MFRSAKYEKSSSERIFEDIKINLPCLKKYIFPRQSKRYEVQRMWKQITKRMFQTENIYIYNPIKEKYEIDKKWSKESELF